MTAPKPKRRRPEREAAADRWAERTMPREAEGYGVEELGVGATDAETVERVMAGRVRAVDWSLA